MNDDPRFSVLFVCLGNICRSPTAQGVFQHLAEGQGLGDRVEVDSAGTAAFHIGSKPDHRSIKAAANRGYDLSRLKARQVLEQDFYHYDYILAMDNDNLSNLRKIQPADGKARVQLMLDHAEHTGFSEVPDPYYGGARGFDLVLDLIEEGAQGMLG